MRKILVSLLLFYSSVKFVIANEETWYGPFVFYEDIPNAVFYFANVSKGHNVNLMDALRYEASIDTVVLMSDGGSTYEGLNLSGTIHDRNLNTYVPSLDGPKHGCYSSCSIMFFAGKNRWIDGELGVHQFYYPQSENVFTVSQKESVENTQTLVAQIINIFNDYNVPNFVLGRLFRTPGDKMYFMDEDDIKQIQLVNSTNTPSNQNCIDMRAKEINFALGQKNFDGFTLCKVSSPAEKFLESSNISKAVTRPVTGIYEVTECVGKLNKNLRISSLEISSYRKSFGGYNVNFLADDGETLNFGNARFYFTASGDLITDAHRESILFGGQFESFDAAFKIVSNGQNKGELQLAMEPGKLQCSILKN